MNRRHFISNSTLPSHIKAKIRARMRGSAATDHMWRVFYKPDDAVFCNPVTTTGRRKVQALKADGWVELGIYSRSAPLVEDLEWIRGEMFGYN